MQEVKVKVDALLSVLRANRDAHKDLFERALEGYRRRAVEELERIIVDAKAGRHFARGIGLPEPVNQTKDYDRVIRMLEMSVDTEIELSQQEFAQYVMDDWSWKQHVWATNSSYTVTT